MAQFRPGRDDLPEPPQVRRLRLLVSALMVVLIGGMLIVVAAMVIRLGVLGAPDKAALGPVTAANLALPAGAEAVALGRGPGEVLILTRDAAGAETLRVFDAASGAEKSATPISRK
jgi:hypothetical protein